MPKSAMTWQAVFEARNLEALEKLLVYTISVLKKLYLCGFLVTKSYYSFYPQAK